MERHMHPGAFPTNYDEYDEYDFPEQPVPDQRLPRRNQQHQLGRKQRNMGLAQYGHGYNGGPRHMQGGQGEFDMTQHTMGLIQTMQLGILWSFAMWYMQLEVRPS